jgi:hypothetical protein
MAEESDDAREVTMPGGEGRGGREREREKHGRRGKKGRRRRRTRMGRDEGKSRKRGSGGDTHKERVGGG